MYGAHERTLYLPPAPAWAQSFKLLRAHIQLRLSGAGRPSVASFATDLGDRALRVTFFTGSVIGYVDNPAALLTRGLAHGLALRGHDVRVVESRRNPAFVRTMEQAGAAAARHFFDAFPTIQYHTYEPRSGASLLEWVTREIALLDVAVAVGGLDRELCRWIANVSRQRLLRAYLPWTLADVAPKRLLELEIALFDAVLAPFDVGGFTTHVRPIVAAVAGVDVEAGLTRDLESDYAVSLSDPIEAAIAFERATTLPAPPR
ncbi:MAG TPA: hypothetical protein VMM78_15225 [Thermomicrobiales bacterium]|nr:hypothetical protein [Thermomicrobiales bacterium]